MCVKRVIRKRHESNLSKIRRSRTKIVFTASLPKPRSRVDWTGIADKAICSTSPQEEICPANLTPIFLPLFLSHSVTVIPSQRTSPWTCTSASSGRIRASHSTRGRASRSWWWAPSTSTWSGCRTRSLSTRRRRTSTRPPRRTSSCGYWPRERCSEALGELEPVLRHQQQKSKWDPATLIPAQWCFLKRPTIYFKKEMPTYHRQCPKTLLRTPNAPSSAVAFVCICGWLSAVPLLLLVWLLVSTNDQLYFDTQTQLMAGFSSFVWLGTCRLSSKTAVKALLWKWLEYLYGIKWNGCFL